MDVLFAMHDCALGISPVPSYSGVKEFVATASIVPLQALWEDVEGKL